ncbi:MAG: translocation/assembly module TamB domain-containing protein [Bacteroidales bacterium]
MFLYTTVYVVLSIPVIQSEITTTLSKELSEYFDASVEIKEVKPELFDKISLREVTIKDQHNATILSANKIAANINLWKLTKRRLVINTIQLFSFDAHLYRESSHDPLNIQFIIDKFKPKKPKKKKGLIEIQLRTILVRRGNVSYDNYGRPSTPGVFNADHIGIKNLLASVSIKTISSDSVQAVVKRISFQEQAGFELKKLAFDIEGNKQGFRLTDFQLNLNNSSLNIDTAYTDFKNCPIITNRETIFKFRKEWKDSLLKHTEIYARITPSFVSTEDFTSFIPKLKELPAVVSVQGTLSGSIDNPVLDKFYLSGKELFHLDMRASVSGLTNLKDAYMFTEINNLFIAPEAIDMLTHAFIPKKSYVHELGEHAGITQMKLSASGFLNDFQIHTTVHNKLGKVVLNSEMKYSLKDSMWCAQGGVSANDVFLKVLVPAKDAEMLDRGNLWCDYSGSWAPGKKPTAKVNGELFDFDFKGYRYGNVRFKALYSPANIEAQVGMNDLNGYAYIKAQLLNLGTKNQSLHSVIDVTGLNTDALNLTKKNKNLTFSGKGQIDLSGAGLNDISGSIRFDSLEIENNENKVEIRNLYIDADQKQTYKQIKINSSLLNGSIRGDYKLTNIPGNMLTVFANELPALFRTIPIKNKEAEAQNHIIYDFETGDLNPLFHILGVPFETKRSVSLSGFFDNRTQRYDLSLIVPECKIGKTILDQSQLYLHNDNGNQNLEVRTTTFNKKQQPANIKLNVVGRNDSVFTNVTVSNSASKTFGGELNLASYWRTNDQKKLEGHVEILPANVIVNDTIWNIAPANIYLRNEGIWVDQFSISHQNQYVKINGKASKLPTDTLDLQLQSINLDYVFDLLNVANVHFGGYASGDFKLSDFEKIPHIFTNNFNVKNFSFSNAYLGDLSLYSEWNKEQMGILMQGAIKEGDNMSYVDGFIFPTKGSLDLSFDASDLNIGFINQFVSSVFTKFEGRATGYVRLFGNFSKLALDGNADLHNVNLGVGYTNTEYTINDKIYLEPERIYFQNAQLIDSKGNKGKASGEMTHVGFKDIRYDINLFPENMLVFNTGKNQNDLFFGTVYATGKASIKGDEGNVNISLNGRTEPNSHFTFSIGGSASAGEYQFLTFRDKKAAYDSQKAGSDSLQTEPAVKENPSSVINIDLQVDVTPESKLTLIMDEVTGDEIQTTGNGSMRLTYNSRSEDVKLYGTYTIEKGDYYFNLQNLFLREFQIQNGSSVVFRGNPMGADLNINAIYSLTANLVDLNENFVNDRDLSRTNVPVHCMLKITGDMLHPDLDFDISLPSNSDDINRKVKSIIGTPEMLNQQIIYLLLVNKFYTIDVGDNKQRNELSAIASSTISSQLNNILRQVSNNWNLGTNIRSDKGDFSDIEVELALSSQLLNNRLLINGNFGYKDNPKSQTNFIGDIDAEYKLTKSGNLRLKGYNKTNDRNYYIKSSATTQGVGLIYKRDFDKIMDLFRKRIKKKNKQENENKTDDPSINSEEKIEK